MKEMGSMNRQKRPRVARAWVTLFAGFWILAFAGIELRAQVATGEIDGTIRDSTGAVIPSANVVVTNTDQHLVVRTIKTNGQGEFTAPLLVVGGYSITASASGFETGRLEGLQVHVGQQTSAMLALRVGSSVMEVTVTAAPVTAELENAASSSVLESKEVTALPLSSRNYLQLMTLQPGISGNIPGPDERGNITPFGAVNTQSFSVNGGTTASNGYFLDGADTLKRAGQQPVAFPSIDFIQEINLQRANYGAEFGGAGAAFVSVQTKTGGSAFHGSAFGFIRNRVLNANTYFAKQATTPLDRAAYRYGDFGFAIGGPFWIPKHGSRETAKTFFFFGQQYLRSLQGQTTTITNVATSGSNGTANERAGVFPTPVCLVYNAAGTACTTSGTRVAAIDAIAQEYLKDIIGKEPAPNSPTDLHGLIYNAQGTNNETQTIIRIDHQFNSKLSVFMRYLDDPFHLLVPFGFQAPSMIPGVATSTMTNGSTNWLGNVTWTITQNHLLEVGYSHRANWVTAQPIGSMWAANSPDIQVNLPYVNTLGQVPHVNIGGSSFVTTGPYLELNPISQVFVNSTHMYGRHTIKAGFNGEWQLGGSTAAGANAGTFSFTATPVPAGSGTVQFDQAFANFLLSRASTFTQANIDIAATNHTNIYEAYLQDDFHFSNRLTLSAGLRYSYFGSATAAQLSGKYLPTPVLNFDPDTYSTTQAPTIDNNGLICTAAPCSGGKTPSATYNTTNGIIMGDKNSPFGSTVQATPNLNFAPRAGFAYDLTGDGKTSIRGGFGIFFISVTANQAKFATGQDVPNVFTPSISNVTFENPSGGSLSSAPTSLQALQIHDPASYDEEYNLDIQRELHEGLVLDVGYYGNRGVHLFNNIDANQPVAGAYVTGTNIPAGSVNSSNTQKLNQIRPYQGYSFITSQMSIFSANYNSLQAKLMARLHHGVLVTGNYAWSNALTNSRTPQNNANLRAEYGPTPYDRTHIFNVSVNYPIPVYRNQHGIIGHTLGGFSIGAIGSYATGQYLTEGNSAVDPAGLGLLVGPAGARPDYVSNPNAGAPHTLKEWFNVAAFAAVQAGVVRAGNSPVGNIKGPGYETWDCNVAKNINLVRETKFEFRAEAFNILNHTNFSGVSTTLGATNNGQVTSAGPNRVVQFGSKIIF